MTKRSESVIRGQFQTRRTRLLYFIYKSRGRKIRNDSGIKSKLRRAFDYKSDGHLYHDLNYLINHGLLQEKNGYYVVTKSGRKEFMLLSTLRIATWMSLFLGGYIAILGLAQMLIPVVIVREHFLILLGIMLLGYGGVYWLSLRTFSPHPPDRKDELTN